MIALLNPHLTSTNTRILITVIRNAKADT